MFLFACIVFYFTPLILYHRFSGGNVHMGGRPPLESSWWRTRGKRKKNIFFQRKRKAWWKEKKRWQIKTFPSKECHPLNRPHLATEQKSTVEETSQLHKGLAFHAMLVISMPESMFITLTQQEIVARFPIDLLEKGK